MSVVVAIKKDGVVYIGADTQTTTGSAKANYTKESNLKIITLENGIVLGHVGAVARKNIFFHSKNVFPKLKLKNGLTKEVIVEQLLPLLKKDKVFCNDDGHVEISAVLAYKDRLFKIKNEVVTEIGRYCAIGAGYDFAWAHLEDGWKKHDPVSLLHKALDASARNIPSVSAPFVVVNTKDLSIEVIK